MSDAAVLAWEPPATDKTVRKPPRRTRGKPNNVDVHVGGRVRQRRMLLGMSQEKLADALGLTFQQVQKYERGANRIGAGRLYALSNALEVPVSYFFEDLDAPTTVQPVRESQQVDPMGRRETLNLVRSYYGITDQAIRRRMLDLMKSLAHEPDVVEEF